jgi:hypothetical protein
LPSTQLHVQEYQPVQASHSISAAHLQQQNGYADRKLVQMNFLLGLITLVGGAAEQVLGHLERHHWFIGLIVIGYIFHLHDKSLHARFDALEKRVDEVRKRLACDN